MADRVDARMYSMQTAGADPPLNLFFTPPLILQLAAPHDPVLPLRQLRERSIVSARP